MPEAIIYRKVIVKGPPPTTSQRFWRVRPLRRRSRAPPHLFQFLPQAAPGTPRGRATRARRRRHVARDARRCTLRRQRPHLPPPRRDPGPPAVRRRGRGRRRTRRLGLGVGRAGCAHGPARAELGALGRACGARPALGRRCARLGCREQAREPYAGRVRGPAGQGGDGARGARSRVCVCVGVIGGRGCARAPGWKDGAPAGDEGRASLRLGRLSGCGRQELEIARVAVARMSAVSREWSNIYALDSFMVYLGLLCLPPVRKRFLCTDLSEKSEIMHRVKRTEDITLVHLARSLCL